MTMYGVSDEEWTKWKRKRRNTLIAFLIFGTLEGIDSSLISSTLYFYLRSEVTDDSQRMTYYSLVIAGFYACASVSGLLCGRWLDRTRKVGQCTIFSHLRYSTPPPIDTQITPSIYFIKAVS